MHELHWVSVWHLMLHCFFQLPDNLCEHSCLDLIKEDYYVVYNLPNNI